MKRAFVAVALLCAGVAALAGEGCEFSCQNMCPLAKKAGAMRSFGAEGSAARTQALAAQVQKGLARI